MGDEVLFPLLRSPLQPSLGILTGRFPSGGLDPAVTTYSAAITAAGGSLTAPQTTALNAFVVSAKATGVWSKLLEVGVFLGGTLASAAVKLKYPVAQNCVLNSFVLGDLTSLGLKGNGSKWVNTQTTPNQLTADGSMGIGVFLSEEITSASFSQMMGTNAGGNPQITLRWLGDGWVDSHLGGSGATTASFYNQRQKMPIGLVHTQRVGTTINGYKGGISAVSNGSGFSYAGSTTPLAVFSGDGGGNPTAMTAGAYIFTDGTVTDADATNIANAINVLMAALGRMVPSVKPLRYVPIIGQSLAVGATGTPVLSTTQPYKNLMADSGTAGGNVSSPVPDYYNAFGQGAQPGDLAAMIELNQETISSGAANTIGMMARADGLGDLQDLLTHNVGLGATAYVGLKKGTNPYNNSVAVATAFKSPQPLYATQPIMVPGLFCVHGESDAASNTYGLDCRQWQSDYETDFKAVTGQSGTIPIFHTQTSSWSSVNNINSATAAAPYALLAEFETNPTKTIVVGPKYVYAYAPDGVHITNVGYRALGELYAKAYYQHVVKGIPWSPLTPVSISRTGAVIDVTFAGNVGTLVLDNVSVTDPSGNNTYGFEYTDSAGGNFYTRIASVAVLSANVIRVTLTADPTANTGKTLRYAFTGTVGNSGGPTTGPRGCLRDSDTTTGQSGTVLRNWCVHFSKAVT